MDVVEAIDTVSGANEVGKVLDVSKGERDGSRRDAFLADE